jgi:LEA14-like dessication related protein
MMRATLAVTMLLASMPNCTDLYSVATHGLTTPTVTTDPQHAPFPTLDSAGLRINIPLAATNPNAFPISVDSVDYQVFLDPAPAAPAFTGTQEGTTVDEQSSETVTVGGVIPLSVVTSRRFTRGQTVNFTVTGTAHVDSPAGVAIDVAFAASSSFVVP